MAAHADPDAPSLGLNKLLTEEPIGISLRTTKPHRFRALFVDDILASSWEEKALHNLDLDSYMNELANVRSRLADFAFQLFDVYCKDFSLLATKEQHDEIKKDLRAKQKR